MDTLRLLIAQAPSAVANDRHGLTHSVAPGSEQAARPLGFIVTQLQATAALAHSNLAVSLLALGEVQEAKGHTRAALELLATAAGAAISTKPTLYVRAGVLLCTGVRILLAFP
jgi:hypothetical protein